MPRSFRSARRKRSVAWIPGLTTYDTAAATALRQRQVSLTVVNAAVPDTVGAAIALTDDTDLSMHGGEDAVITRIRGRLYFSDGRIDAGAGLTASAFQVRVIVAQQNITPGAQTMPMDFTTSDGLGNDTILYYNDVIVPSTVTSGAGTGMDAIEWGGRMLELDVKAKRKLQSDNQIVLWFQTVINAPTANGGDFILRGGLRMLLMRSK